MDTSRTSNLKLWTKKRQSNAVCGSFFQGGHKDTMAHLIGRLTSCVSCNCSHYLKVELKVPLEGGGGAGGIIFVSWCFFSQSSVTQTALYVASPRLQPPTMWPLGQVVCGLLWLAGQTLTLLGGGISGHKVLFETLKRAPGANESWTLILPLLQNKYLTMWEVAPTAESLKHGNIKLCFDQFTSRFLCSPEQRPSNRLAL